MFIGERKPYREWTEQEFDQSQMSCFKRHASAYMVMKKTIGSE